MVIPDPLKKVPKTTLFAFIMAMLSVMTYGQTVPRPAVDTAKKPKPLDFVHTMQKRGTDEADRSIKLWDRERTAAHQKSIILKIKTLDQEMKIFLKTQLDTVGIGRLIRESEATIKTVEDGVFVNKGSNQTQRNLAVSSSVLSQLLVLVERQKAIVDRYADKLDDFRMNSDSLQADPKVYSFSSDSTEVVKYLDKLRVIVAELGPVDTALNKAIVSTQKIQLKVDMLVFELRSRIEDIEIYSSKLSDKALSKEFPYLWAPVGSYSRPFEEILHFSTLKTSLLLHYYLKKNLILLIVLVALCACSFLFLSALKRQVQQEHGLSPNRAEQLVIKHPLFSATVLGLCIFQFLFADPPFTLSFMIWLISAICLVFIFRDFITPYWMRFWIVMVVFFIIAGLDNMVLQTSRVERIFDACLSVAGMVFTGSVLFSKRKEELREKSILYFIAFVFLCQAAALALNLLGRFNLSKTLFVAGFTGVIIAILFLWVARLLNEGLLLASSVYKQPTRKLFFLNFKRVGNEVPPFFYVLLVMGWLFLVGRNFYSFRKIYDSFIYALTEQRAVGDYQFSIMGLLIFLLVLIFSVALSKLVSFFASEPVGAHVKTGDEKKLKLGSYILLVRIAIICLGIFFSFAAAGIALDKITIIFGALGVGVGLGLQGLVNNLVSGLVLSFERPVNVGDVIEVNGKMATMRAIGFRSSTIVSSDGSCVIIPNGELLNKQVVNWTMGQSLKQNILTVSVAYDTDLAKAKSLLFKLLQADERILQHPHPDVVLKEFKSGGVGIDVVFWPTNISLSGVVKSDLILKISAQFKKEGIVMQQEEVYVHQVVDLQKRDGPGDNRL